MSVLKVENLSKSFAHYTAVNSISFDLKQGEILGFLGPNGAGKTTTIQMLLGTLTPSCGSIDYFGNDFAAYRIASLKKIGYASGYEKLPSRLTVVENLDIIGRMYGIQKSDRRERIQDLLVFFGIEHMANRPVGTLSAGQSTRVMLAKAFLGRPKIVLLDEPTASLDPDVAFDVRQFILSQRAQKNTAVLITSHNMHEVTQLCDRVLVLKHGSLIANSSPQQLAQTVSKVRMHLMITSSSDILENYLGETGLIYSKESSQVTIEIDEDNIASFLATIGEKGITYSHISIDKPTLEDYFLSIAR